MIQSVEELEGLKKQFLTTKQVAEALGLKEGTLEKWRRSKRHVLPYSKIGKTIRYRGEHVIALFEPQGGADPAIQPARRRRRRAA
ncbi:MAG: helix-turn-helix domain-containing protein [Candidatus Acidiferrum sp.]